MDNSGVSPTRYGLLIFIIGCTGIFLASRGSVESIPHPPQLRSFPNHVDTWFGREETIDAEVLHVLGPGDFLSRLYVTPKQPYLGLFIAFFASQRAGDAIHSPKNCVPGAGWAPISAGRLRIQTLDGHMVNANRYIIQKGIDRQLVIYWYQAHGRTMASEYSAKLYLVIDAIRLNRTDGALVRIVTPVIGGYDDPERIAEIRAVSFAREIIPKLDEYVPR